MFVLSTPPNVQKMYEKMNEEKAIFVQPFFSLVLVPMMHYDAPSLLHK